MQGLADGYFVIPYTIGNYLASTKLERIAADHPDVQAHRGRSRRAHARSCSPIDGKRTTASFHRELGQDHVGPLRHGAEREGPDRGPRRDPRAARGVLGATCSVLGDGDELNQSLEQAGRVADFLELGELMCLRRPRSGASRAAATSARSIQTADGEALRDDEQLLPRRRLGVSQATGSAPVRHVEPLAFENVHLATRSYK